MRRKNIKRAKDAEAVLRFYIAYRKGAKYEPGTETDCHLTDLLADLMHWCEWKKLANFKNCHRIAVNHFTEEQAGRDDMP